MYWKSENAVVAGIRHIDDGWGHRIIHGDAERLRHLAALDHVRAEGIEGQRVGGGADEVGIPEDLSGLVEKRLRGNGTGKQKRNTQY